jgi:hypothetical protein
MELQPRTEVEPAPPHTAQVRTEHPSTTSALAMVYVSSETAWLQKGAGEKARKLQLQLQSWHECDSGFHKIAPIPFSQSLFFCERSD